MTYKSKRIKEIVNYLSEKYGTSNINVDDYWDADDTAIGLSDKTRNYLVYISILGCKGNKFFVALEDPPTSDESPYTPGETFDNITADEVERILVKHLRIE